MASKLKDKAKAKAQPKSKLASKAKSRAPSVEAKTQDEIERDEQMPDAPSMADSMPFNASPPLPPPLAYLRKFATIPALRKGDQGGGP